MADLIQFWFSVKGESLWFNATKEDDALITQEFAHLIQDEPVFPKNQDKFLEHILIYDQIIRHVFRGNSEKIQALSPHALELSLHILDHNLDLEFSDKERCFILLPLRHTFDLRMVERAFKKVQEYRQGSDSKYYIRFYKATILSLSQIKTPLIEPEPINNIITNEDIFKTLDPNCIPNLSDIMLLDRTEQIYRAFSKTLRKIKDLKEITLSLSGGVDSMISSFILYHLSEKQTRFKIIAVSINYNNREDNKYEMEFIKRWCHLLGITHYIRHITELHRNRSSDRDIYEKITRKIRFAMYKRFGNPVILGHNQDDCLENIFNNIKKTRSCANLKGMSEFVLDEESGVTLVRPMLKINKTDIRAFAKKYHVPHLPNSTPAWSERGKIRDELVVFMNQFDPALIPGFLKLAENMEEIYTIYDKSVVNKFFESITFSETDVVIRLTPDSDEKNYGFIFWKDIVCQIFKKLGYDLPTNRSVKALSKRIQNNSYGKINMTKNIIFIYTLDKLTLTL